MPGKVTIFGAGNVGTASAFSTALDGTPDELVLFDVNVDKAEGEIQDIDHASAFIPHTEFSATDEYSRTAGSDVLVITAGARQSEGESRLDLTGRNYDIMHSILRKAIEYSPDAIILVVSNPVDVLTYFAKEISGFENARVFGTGTTLDTARLQSKLEREFNVNSKNVHAYVIGEHGDSSFVAIQSAHVAGVPLSKMEGFSHERILEIHEEVRAAAYDLIKKKGYTNLAIGVSVSRIVHAILDNTHEVFPVSSVLEGEYGLNGCALSTPCIIGRNGIEKKLELPLSNEEKQSLMSCAGMMKEVIAHQAKK